MTIIHFANSNIREITYSMFLSGTSLSPNTSVVRGLTDPSGWSGFAGWRFNTDGTIDESNNDGSAWEVSSLSPWYTGVAPDLWIKATLDDGGPVDTGTVGSWLKVVGTGGSNRSWYDSLTVGAFGAGSESFVILLEVSTDALGVDVIASGYYGGDILATQ